jgi:thioredoxin reductase (NADPH)
MTLDCIIIGGGPAGLTAATYLARYRRSVTVFDAGNSRALSIPESHNHPGFFGISGDALLERLRAQAQRYKVEIRNARVAKLEKRGAGFSASTEDGDFSAARVLVATGITDHSPQLPGLDEAVAKALVRYCPICDGYEAMDKSIAVYGPVDTAISKACFLRTYSKSLYLLPAHPVSDAQRKKAHDQGIEIALCPPKKFAQTKSGMAITLEDDTQLDFDVLYPVLGCNVHSDLARGLGARCNDGGLIEVNDKQQTSVEGLYAAGDVVSDLHQLSVAEGHAAIAATAIHNSLPHNFR